MTAPVDQLAKESFGAAASQFVEIERPTFTGMGGPDGPLYGLLFATKPRAVDTGICEATVAEVSTGQALGDGGSPVTTWTAYKIVSSTKPDNKWNNAYAASLAGSCANAGRVIPTESADFGQVGFAKIVYPSDLRAWFAARSVEVALEAFRKGPMQVHCENIQSADGLAGACIMAALPSSALRMDRVTSITMDRGCVGANGNCYTVKAEFLRSGRFNEQNVWLLDFNAYLSGSLTGDDVIRADNLKLISGTRIFD